MPLLKYKSLKLVANNSNNPENNTSKYSRSHKIRYEQNVPHQFTNSLMPLNAFEQKDRFLRRGLTPEFHLKVLPGELESALLHTSGSITFTLFREATRILDTVCRRFKSIDNFIEQSFGRRITVEEATEKITEYIKESNLPTNLDIIWCEDLVGSALMCSTGVDKNGNVPRTRKFTMLLKTNEENTYLRERGITCLMDHELGTHYHRSFNEGLQPWYGKRDLYGLGPTNTGESIKIEEGLACLHTILNAEHRYLGVPALLYYGSCMAEYLPFKDLFEHLGKYVTNEEQRWKHCMRIKRCLPSQDRCGGYGKDQRYFEGAVTILRNQASIDFHLLMAGKLTLDELERARRYALTSGIRLPAFMQDKEKYLNSLKQIARMNGIIIQKPQNSKFNSGSVRPSATPKPSPIIQSGVTNPGSSITPKISKTASYSQASGESTAENMHSRKIKQTTVCSKSIPTSADEKRSEPKQTEANYNITPHIVQQTPSRINPNQKITSTKISPIPLSSNCSETKFIQTAQNIIRDKILKTLSIFELFGVCKLTSSIICKPTSDNITQSKTKYFSPAPIKKLINSPPSNEINMENNLRTLPKGICGCRLFTHGSLKCNSFTNDANLKQNKESKESHQVNVPMILEIDLRHPLVGV